jgi:hypothetical protein
VTGRCGWRDAAVVACCALAGAATAQQPLPAPLLKPFADNRQWIVVDDFTYIIGDTRVGVTVPRGFVTDFASIPQAFWSLGLSPNGTYSRAAIIHDFLYWTQACTRLEADNLLFIAMTESRVPEATRETIYRGVRVGGGAAWSANAAERARGLPRVVPADAMAIGPLDLWDGYRAKLVEAGARDPAFESAPPYCALGARAEVPTTGWTP